MGIVWDQKNTKNELGDLVYGHFNGILGVFWVILRHFGCFWGLNDPKLCPGILPCSPNHPPGCPTCFFDGPCDFFFTKKEFLDQKKDFFSKINFFGKFSRFFSSFFDQKIIFPPETRVENPKILFFWKKIEIFPFLGKNSLCWGFLEFFQFF